MTLHKICHHAATLASLTGNKVVTRTDIYIELSFKDYNLLRAEIRISSYVHYIGSGSCWVRIIGVTFYIKLI